MRKITYYIKCQKGRLHLEQVRGYLVEHAVRPFAVQKEGRYWQSTDLGTGMALMTFGVKTRAGAVEETVRRIEAVRDGFWDSEYVKAMEREYQALLAAQDQKGADDA